MEKGFNEWEKRVREEIRSKNGCAWVGSFCRLVYFFSWTDLTDNILRVGVPQSIIVEGGDMGKKRVQV